MNHVERRILTVTCFGHFMSHYNSLVFPALVLPLVATLNLELAQVLGLSFWMYLLFGVTALPWGLVGDRWDGRALLAIMFLGSGLSGLAAAYFIESPGALSVALAGVGLFSGIYHPIGMGLISKGVSRLSLAMGYNALFGGLGLAIAPLATGIINWLSGPAAAFIGLGILNFAGLALMAMLPLTQAETHEEAVTERNGGSPVAFLIVLIAGGLAGIAYSAAIVILPAYLELKSQEIFNGLTRVFGTGLSSNLLATTITAMVYVVGMLGQYVGGRVGEARDMRYSYLVFHIVCIPAALFMAFTSNLPLVGFAFIYFFFMLGMQALENSLVAGYTPRRLHHSAFGLKFVFTFGVGSIGVKMAQWIDKAWGIDATFVALAAISVVLVASIVALIIWTNRSVSQTTETIAQAPSATVEA